MKLSDFGLDDWVVRPQRSVIERGDASVHLKPKSMAVLECLAQAGGDVVSREELFDTVWPGGVVSDDVLTQCIVELRKAFGDTARNAHFIETIPKKGFRIVPKVLPLSGRNGGIAQGLADDGTPGRQPGEPDKNSPSWWPNKAVPPLAIAVLISAFLVWYQFLNAPLERDSVLVIEDTQSIAVLPFADLSNEKDQEYFADGLSEDLLNKLARIKDLRVSGRTSSFYFKGKNAKLQEIAAALDVGHILEGSVRRAGNELRITAQLVDVSNGFQTWSDNYDRPLEDIFNIQDEIAEAVAMALSITLGVGDIGGVIGGTANPDAYNEYLLAQALYREFTADSISAAIEHFKLAIEIDANYALAWERLADVYVSSLYAPGLEIPGDWRELSEEALKNAISLAPDSQAVIATTAYRHIHLNEWREAALALQQGEDPEASTNDTLVRTSAHLLGSVGRGREAIPLMERARRLDPLAGIVSIYLVPEYVEVGRYEEADADLEQSWGLGEYRELFAWIGLSIAFSSRDMALMDKWTGRFLEVFNDWGGNGQRKMLELVDNPETALDWLRGRYDAGEEIVLISSWAAFLGDHELALKTLPGYANPQLYWYENYAGVRRLEGFKDVVRQSGLVEYWREIGWGEHCAPLGEDDFECF